MPQPQKKLEEIVEERRQMKNAMLGLFGSCETDSSFYLLPPGGNSRMVMVMLADEGQAKELAKRLIDREIRQVQYIGRVVAFNVNDAEECNPVIERGVKTKKIVETLRADFDPRGQIIDNWTDEELRQYLTDNHLAPRSVNVGKLPRADCVKLITDDYFGRTGAGAAAVDPEDGVAKRLLKIFDTLKKAPAARGKVQAGRVLIRTLEPHAEGRFETGRKRRIAELRKLLAIVVLKEKTTEGIRAALLEMGKL